MTDLELLELCAKAANIRFVGYDEYYQDFCAYDPETDVNYQWNPLESDGDAFRLAVKLKLAIFVCNGVVIVETEMDSKDAFELLMSDPCAATRRAIVIAAAKLDDSNLHISSDGV